MLLTHPFLWHKLVPVKKYFLDSFNFIQTSPAEWCVFLDTWQCENTSEIWNLKSDILVLNISNLNHLSSRFQSKIFKHRPSWLRMIHVNCFFIRSMLIFSLVSLFPGINFSWSFFLLLPCPGSYGLSQRFHLLHVCPPKKTSRECTCIFTFERAFALPKCIFPSND